MSSQSLHEEAKTKIKESIAGLSKKCNEIEYKIHIGTIILVSALVLMFAVCGGKYTSVTELHNFEENIKLQNDQITEAVIEASANIEILKHFSIFVLHHFISGLILH